jgi:hypothetical protein
MTNYYIQQNDKIVIFDTDKAKLQTTLDFMPQYKDLEIQETERPIVLCEDCGAFEFADTDSYLSEQAIKKRADLVQTLYDIKAERAYGGVIINNAFKFETNQTSITNTVASLALMNNTDTSNWKFYTLEGQPVVYQITKAQLYAIAQFGQNMINECFKVEGEYNTDLAQATQDDLLSDSWIQEFIENATSAMETVVNTITVELKSNSPEIPESSTDKENLTVEEPTTEENSEVEE